MKHEIRNNKGRYAKSGIINTMKRVILGFGKLVKWTLILGTAGLIGFSYSNITNGNEIRIEPEADTNEVIEQLIQREIKRIETDPHSQAAIERMFRGLAIEAINGRITEKFEEVEKDKEVAELKAKVVN